MAPVKCLDAARASTVGSPHEELDSGSDSYPLIDLEDELKRLSAANQELLDEFQHAEHAESPAAADHSDELEQLRYENTELKMRIQELEALANGQAEELWLERQREYEALLEEKSEVIRGLHQHIQEMQESVNLGEAPPVTAGVSVSATKLGQAEEILRLKRELEEQRKQLEQDEEDMMAQMRQMEMMMAKERAEMARQRQEIQRLQSDLAREIEQSSRDPDLRDRLASLRRSSDGKQSGTTATAGGAGRPKTMPPVEPAPETPQKSSGFFRRIFG